MSIDALSMLCASTLTYCEPSGVSSSLDKLTRSEFAGYLSGLPSLYFDFALAKYCLDDSSLRKFISGIRDQLKNDDPRIQASMLFVIASMEIIRPIRCKKCDGRKFVGSKLCPSCDGLGTLRCSGRQIAEDIGVSQNEWQRKWIQFYKQLITFIQDIDSEVKIHYAKATRSDCMIAM